MEPTEKIECKICGAKVHSIQIHLRDEHKEITLSSYVADYPEAPLLSELATKKLEENKAKRAAEEGRVEMAGASAAVLTFSNSVGGVTKRPFHEVFKLGKVKAAMNGRGDPILIETIDPHSHQSLVPEIDEAYVFDIELLKNAMIGIELGVPVYAWGHAGTGKTTLFEQIMAHTNRPMLRVQHTVNTEESHIVGQWTVKGGHTIFELGPLPMAMINGWVYMADEYDFALPSVLSVYQAVLEGKSLVIKEADAENRVIKPHPNFRICATGNTNGSGDETGLYQGTNLQNAANYERFGVVERVTYMNPKQEAQVVKNQAGLVQEDADKLVQFAGYVREAFDGNKISATISPRTLIMAGKLGLRKGSWRSGLALCFMNRLNSLDKEVCDGLAQRVFG